MSSTAAPVRDGVAVTFDRVLKQFPGMTALNNLSLDIAPGEFVALLGPSGCGKTTALRCLAGLEQISGGALLIDGEDVADVPVNKRDLGMVFQSYSLFPNLDVRRNVEFGLQTRGISAKERTAAAMEMLELVGLAHKADSYADELSGGQQQRVALARALVTRPRVLLLDEPLSALDAKVRATLRDEIRKIQLTLGITTVFVTHDQEEALAVADRIAVMNGGIIEQIGTPEELYQKPATPFVAEFIGLSNTIVGQVTSGRVAVLGNSLELLNPEFGDGHAEAFVRPEDLVIAVDNGGDHGSAGVVTATSFLGSMRRTRVLLGDGSELSVQHTVGHSFEIGESVRVSVGDIAVTARSIKH